MNIAQLINHPEQLDKETLYELRAIVALHPYYQPARLLLLHNLYLLHDPTFDEELRRAAIYITDRNRLFQLVEAAHYHLRKPQTKQENVAPNAQKQDRTTSLIDNFLESIPEENKETTKNKRRPTPADATIDYVAYLLETEEQTTQAENSLTMSLIDNFINQEGGSFELKDNPEFLPEAEYIGQEQENDSDDGYFTETLARIYIKQGRYSKALEIIQRLNLVYPKKNRYFADQIRFLEKLIQNNNKKK